MSIPEVTQRCNTLRSDLKTWETKFAATNGGRKASREDIKADAIIAQKYKEYNRLRETLSAAHDRSPSKRSATRTIAHDVGRMQRFANIEEAALWKRKREGSSAPTQDALVKRKREDNDIHTNEALKKKKIGRVEAHMRTPQKKKPIETNTPSRPSSSPDQSFSPAFIGPTPQRDGKVLGLFDILPEETPSKNRMILGRTEINILKTPSKTSSKADMVVTPQTTRKWERTPMSSGRRFLLNQFVSPPKTEQGTPTSASKYPQTPSFLRRGVNLAPIDENHEPTPRIAPWKRATLFSRLSVVQAAQARKRKEEERYDEDADIMRELELEEMGAPSAKKQSFQEKISVVIEDSQPAMPLGPDRNPESEEDDASEAEEAVGPDGKPRKVWKKKGLKRQTRRVIMKPHFSKPAPLPTQAQDDIFEEFDSEVLETQTQSNGNVEDDDLSQDDDSDYASDVSHSQKKAMVQKAKATINASASKSHNSEQGKDLLKQTKDGAVKKAARKIKATAHANYQRLKIKSKGGNGGKGRFGRRR